MARKLSLIFFVVLVLGLVGCDQSTKAAAVSQLAHGNTMEIVPGVLDFSYAENTDMAFGALRWIPPQVRRPFLLTVGFGLVLAFSAVILTGKVRGIEGLGYATALAGAIGNHGDRLFRGHVVDWIHVHHWPVFNVADACLVAGMALIVLAQWRRTRAPG